MTKTALYRHYDANACIKAHTLRRWADKLVADGPTPNPFISDAVRVERHARSVAQTKARADELMRGAA